MLRFYTACLMVFFLMLTLSCGEGKKEIIPPKGKVNDYPKTILGKWYGTKNDGAYVVEFNDGKRMEYYYDELAQTRDYYISNDTLFVGKSTYLEKFRIEKCTDKELHISPVHHGIYQVIFFKRLGK